MNVSATSPKADEGDITVALEQYDTRAGNEVARHFQVERRQ